MKREDGLPLSFTSSLPFLHLHKGDNSIEPKCFTALQASLGAHQSTSQVVLMNQQINQITDLQSQQMSFLAVQKFRNPGMFQDEMGMVQSFGRGRTCPLGSSRFLRNTIHGQMNKGANVPSWFTSAEDFPG